MQSGRIQNCARRNHRRRPTGTKHNFENANRPHLQHKAETTVISIKLGPNHDAFVKSRKPTINVIPAKAGIQKY